ncbi:hypothetical protein N9S22_01275 [Paracoccaceae bacterium]|nr:hypothetical protein [Paracoccaceae bacterium]
MRLIALVLILIAPTWAVAQKFDKTVKLSDIGPFYVELMDGADNGCWTNLMEAKSYAAGQIDIAGGKVVEQSENPKAKAVFTIVVNAARVESGPCFGFVQVSVLRPDYLIGVNVIVYYSQYARPAVKGSNLNNFTLDVIKEAVAEWKD